MYTAVMDDALTFYYQNTPTLISDLVLNIVHTKEHNLINYYNEFLIDIYLLLDNSDSDIIALDWDKTFTVDTGFFNYLIGQLREQEIKPIICTYRSRTKKSMREIQEHLQCQDIPVYHTDGQEKRQYLQAKCIDVHLWIDDLYPTICHSGCSLFSDNGIDYGNDE